MHEVTTRIRTRLAPAVLTALGVTFIAAGLLTYIGPVEAGPGPSESPTIASLPPTAPPATPAPTPSHSDDPGPSPDASPTPPADRVATRVVVPALRIDLPVVPGNDEYPLCNVAQYITDLPQPGWGRAAYLYGHAREGMFLPILTASKIDNGAKMLGMLVEVYTSDDRLFLYEIREVRRHQTSLLDAIAATSEQVWLQTSEGPKGTVGKTQVVAMLLSEGAADPADAHPKPKPVVCG